MNPLLKYLDGFCVMGLSTRTKNEDEFNEKTAKIPTLWQQVHSSDLAESARIIAVYSDFESDEKGYYTLTVGTVDDGTPSECSYGRIQAGHYLVFQNEGPMPFTVIETWKQIWDYFNTQRQYCRHFISDFEEYEDSKVSIYIGIKK